jgi:predicted ATP-grasp superfamily ATP-dependent carboligase
MQRFTEGDFMAAKIQIETKKVVELLAELEYLVVSIDGIGSADISQASRRIELERFFMDGDVFSRLASMRKTLTEVVDQCFSSEERESIEESLEQIKPWVVSQG